MSLVAAARERGPFLLYGLGVTNRAVATALLEHSFDVVVADDGDREQADAFASSLGLECRHPSATDIERLLSSVGALVPTPGLPDAHPALAAAGSLGTTVLSEFDLAAEWDDRPIAAITGTNGKTTVTTLVTQMLLASGIDAVSAGNTEIPLVEAIRQPGPAVFVVEASSFRLAHSGHFAPQVATWLNFAADHLDVHRDLATYRNAKARIFADQAPDDVAVVNLDDSTVAAAAVRARRVTFSVQGPADYHLGDDGILRRPDDSAICERSELPRSLPHDVSNVLAAAATAEPLGATSSGVTAAAVAARLLRHRVERLGESNGVVWVDDSKATTPHAVEAAVAGFRRVVLIAGGRNKGLDLSTLGRLPSVVAVVGIGEAALEVVAGAGDRPSAVASDMGAAVRAARGLAVAGDVVLLSPGCASFDWYPNYEARGDDFAAAVTTELGELTP